MAFDGFINNAIVKELQTCLIDGKIIKVHQPNKDELIFDIYSNKNRYNLDICINSANCRINLTTDKKENPLNPSSFCMLLRKHLIGSRIREISTIGLDRIIVIDLETSNELKDLVNKKLIIELMGKHSNVILTNSDNIIIDSARHISSNRNILPANPYTFPESDKINIYDLSENEFIVFINSKTEKFNNIISNYFYGFSKNLINYINNSLNIDINNISDNEISNFYKYVIALYKNINLLNIDCIEFSFNNKNDYVLISSENSSELNINTFVDTFYTSKEKNEYFENYKSYVLKVILSVLKKYTKRLININEKLKECENMDKFKLYGELLTANLYKINNDINLESITLENYYDNLFPITINLDKRYSPSYNAKRFFKKYNKLKNTLKIVSKQKKDTKKELEYIESIIYSLNTARCINEIDDIYLEMQENITEIKSKVKKNPKNSKKNTETSSPIILNIDGCTVYVGKNNKQNDYITFKMSSKEDLWFHAKDIQGSHVLLKVENNKGISDKTICKCAQIAAYHSKAKDSSKVLVEYTYVKNIKKPKNSKPGFVIFTNYKTLLVSPIDYNS